jgi:hypothetical protein
MRQFYWDIIVDKANFVGVGCWGLDDGCWVLGVGC